MLGRFERFFSTLTQMFQCDPQDICRNGPDAGTWQSSLDKAESLLATCLVNGHHVYGNHLTSSMV
jgi:DNA-binding helix-hairpin-helix protein with protein kinase domain